MFLKNKCTRDRTSILVYTMLHNIPDSLKANQMIQFQLIPGRSGITENAEVDRLAVSTTKIEGFKSYQYYLGPYN